MQPRSPLSVLCGEASEMPAKVREKFDIRQQPKSFSRLTMVLSWRNSILHRQIPPVADPKIRGSACLLLVTNLSCNRALDADRSKRHSLQAKIFPGRLWRSRNKCPNRREVAETLAEKFEPPPVPPTGPEVAVFLAFSIILALHAAAINLGVIYFIPSP